MKRGEVWWVNFDPSIGGEIQKTRPAVIVSNDASNNSMNRVQVIPISSSTGKLYPPEALVTVSGRRCKAMADQVATVSKQRLLRKEDVLSPDELAAVERAIRIQLDLR